MQRVVWWAVGVVSSDICNGIRDGGVVGEGEVIRGIREGGDETGDRDGWMRHSLSHLGTLQLATLLCPC